MAISHVGVIAGVKMLVQAGANIWVTALLGLSAIELAYIIGNFEAALSLMDTIVETGGGVSKQALWHLVKDIKDGPILSMIENMPLASCFRYHPRHLRIIDAENWSSQRDELLQRLNTLTVIVLTLPVDAAPSIVSAIATTEQAEIDYFDDSITDADLNLALMLGTVLPTPPAASHLSALPPAS